MFQFPSWVHGRSSAATKPQHTLHFHIGVFRGKKGAKLMSATPTENSHDPQFRTIDLSAEARKVWGPEWNAPELAYEFSNGRKFKLRTGDASIYETSPDF